MLSSKVAIYTVLQAGQPALGMQTYGLSAAALKNFGCLLTSAFHCLLVLLGTYVYCYICTTYVLLTAHPEDISLP